MHSSAQWNPISRETADPLTWRPHATDAEGALNDEWLLHLIRRLQTTLRVEQLIEIFAGEIREVLEFDGLTYELAAEHISFRDGPRERHSCRYELILAEEGLGAITLTRSRPFSEAETMRFELLASHLVYPLRNALLYHQALIAASRDPLTGSHNRSALETSLERELHLAQRHGTALSVIMLDLDHFKDVNDQHGHIAGDCVLRTLVQRLNQCARQSDTVFRYGGEEFVVVLSNTDLKGARRLAERMRRGVEQMQAECDGLRIHVTVSMGVTAAHSGDTARSLLTRADGALYRSKAEGRNRVTAQS